MNTSPLSWFVSIKRYAAAHKVIATVIALVVLSAVYYAYGVFTAPSTATRYVTTTVATGTVVATMSETGQVSASSNIDVQSKSSGEVLSLPVTAGQHVTAGTALAYLDSTTAAQNVINAKRAVQSAQIALATAQQNVVQAHVSGYEDVASAFLGLSGVISGLDGVLHDSTVPQHLYQENAVAYSNIASANGANLSALQLASENAYQTSYASYTKALSDFKSTPRTADEATIAALITESYQAVQDLSDALRISLNLLDSVNTALKNSEATAPSTLAGHISMLTTYTSTTSVHLTALSNDAMNIPSALSLQNGTDPLNIQSSELSLQERQDALSQAEQALADTVVRAPFTGTVGKLNVQQYQTIGNGSAVATLVSDNQSVSISVNEVDAAKLKVGEKATITFDALPNVSIAGTVSSANTIGTVSSGVVSYGAVVTFDTSSTSVKPGMSATANIITGTETGLVVPSSAVKTSNGQSYVLTFTPPLASSESGAGATSDVAPTQTPVTTGLTDDTTVIIRSGLSAGTQVVTKTVAGTTATTAATSAARSTSVFGGNAPAGGGAVRTLSR